MNKVDVIIIGAGAAGLMCAIEAGKRGRSVLIIDHANKPGKKILISGGGRCNFTNYNIDAQNYISSNPHFCKSALSRFTQWDFIELIHQYKIPYHEREHGQLFCDNSAKDILSMLLSESDKNNVQIKLKTDIKEINKAKNGFQIKTGNDNFQCESLVIATGGLSFPKMSASPFGYKVADQFGISIVKTRAGLVPFTLQPEDKIKYETLSGIAVNSIVKTATAEFKENILFTHRGLSGPAILQASSYWEPCGTVNINLLPDTNLHQLIEQSIEQHPQQILKTLLTQLLPKRLVNIFIEKTILETKVTSLSKQQINDIVNSLQNWQVKPNGTEGYRTAEVTLGGIDCNALSSKTMQSNEHIGLFFIGEVVDVTGWLGGYNFQWAWSSGWCVGQYV